MAIKDFIQKHTKKKDKKFAQVAMEPEIYARINKLLEQHDLTWQKVLHAGLEQFLAEYENGKR